MAGGTEFTTFVSVFRDNAPMLLSRGVDNRAVEFCVSVRGASLIVFWLPVAAKSTAQHPVGRSEGRLLIHTGNPKET